jgi:oligosaccharide translocation protein RFT1
MHRVKALRAAATAAAAAAAATAAAAAAAAPAAGVAAMIELCAEPLYIISSTRLEFGTRASIDTAAMISKCLVTLLLVSRTGLAPALAFAAAQLVFSGVVLAGYGRYGLQLWRQVSC